MKKNKKGRVSVGTESYIVKYWVQNKDGFWEQHEKTYGGYANKDDHARAENDWRKEFQGQNVKLVSVSFQ